MDPTQLFPPPVIKRLNAVDEELVSLKAERDALIPAPIALPEDLPALCRAHVDDLVGTPTDEAVAGPATGELHTLIDTVVVTWDAEERIHWLELLGKLLEWLSVTDIKKAATLSGAACSLELVAGARIGHCFIPANINGLNSSSL